MSLHDAVESSILNARHNEVGALSKLVDTLYMQGLLTNLEMQDLHELALSRYKAVVPDFYAQTASNFYGSGK